MSERAERAVEAAHAEICEESLSDCLDLDWGGGKCYRAVHAALPHLTAQDVTITWTDQDRKRFTQIIRRAKAKAWWEGWDAETAWQDDIDHRTIPTVERKDNPYAKEADHE